jgi:hypothetical protein
VISLRIKQFAYLALAAIIMPPEMFKELTNERGSDEYEYDKLYKQPFGDS